MKRFFTFWLLLHLASVAAQEVPEQLHSWTDSLDRAIIWRSAHQIEHRKNLERLRLQTDDSLKSAILETYILWMDVHARPGEPSLPQKLHQLWKKLDDRHETAYTRWKRRTGYLQLKLPVIRGQYTQLLEQLQAFSSKRQTSKDTTLIVQLSLDLGMIALQLQQWQTAKEYLVLASTLSKATGCCSAEANAYSFLGSLYQFIGEPAEVDEFFQKASVIADACAFSSDLLQAGILLREGQWYSQQRQFALAATHFQEAEHLLKNSEHYELRGFVLAFEARNLYHWGKAFEAKVLAQEGLQEVRHNGLKRVELHLQKLLYEIAIAETRYRDALMLLQEIDVLEDSLTDRQASDALTRLELQLQMQQKELQDSLHFANQNLQLQLEQERILQEERRRQQQLLFAAGLVGILALSLAIRLRQSRKAREAIAKEQQRSEELLLNILPSTIAQELKLNGRATAQYHEKVSILFTDFKNFTQKSAGVAPAQLVQEIDACFSAFDEIMVELKLEKIKTIGDAYMAVAGLQSDDEGAAIRLVEAALRMQEFMHQRKRTAAEPTFEMRVGIHTGAVVAGVVGRKKFQYDLWGDAVNLASRMESAGEVGRVNISEASFSEISSSSLFTFEDRGLQSVKGTAPVRMYFAYRSGQSNFIA